jgi:hypothetical protein
VKKNVALMTRNIQSTKINLDSTTAIPIGNAIYYKPTAPLIDTSVTMVNAFNLSAGSIETVVVQGANLYINADILNNPSLKKARAIIVLKDENGNG